MDIKNFGNRILIVLDDGTARLEVSTGQEKFNRYKDLLQVDQIVVIEGEVYERDGADRPTARLNKAFGMNEIRSKRANAIVLTPPAALLQTNFAQQLQQMILPYCQGETRRIPIQLKLEHQYAHLQLELGASYAVQPDDGLLRELRDFLGKGAILVQYQLKQQQARVG